MAIEPLRPIPVVGRDEEETARLRGAFKSLYAKMYPHWEPTVILAVKEKPPTRANQLSGALSRIAGALGAGTLPLRQHVKLRAQTVLETMKSLVPVTPRERRRYVREVTDDVTGSFIGMWNELLGGSAMQSEGVLDTSKLDEDMLPTDFDPEALNGFLGMLGIPVEDIRAVLKAIRKELPYGQHLPTEMETLLTAAGFRVVTPLEIVN